jgi:hypothetical protein
MFGRDIAHKLKQKIVLADGQVLHGRPYEGS